MTQKDRVEARRRRDEAIARGDAAADAKFKKCLDDAIFYLATAVDEFTTDDVWDHLDDAEIMIPAETRSVGGAMKRAQSKGWIRPTQRVVNSDRPICHCRPVRVWQSRIVED